MPNPTSQQELPPHVWLLLAVGLMALCNLQLLADTWYPIHDNLARYTYFFTFYQEWLLHGDLPHWFPYVNYGVTTAFSQWGAISPMGYLLGSIGAWFRVDQPLLLFKLQLFLEAEFFAIGLALLSVQFYTTWSARLMVIASGILSLIWWFQPNFNFYTCYVLPWILYAMARFFVTRHPLWLGVAAAITLISRIGVFVYFAPVLFWTLILVSLPLWKAHPMAFRVFKDWRLPVFLLPLILAATGLGWLLLHSLDHLALLKVGRDPESGINTLSSFLFYSRLENPEIFGMAFTATTSMGPITDLPLYSGWLPWLLFGYGLFKVRHPWFTGLALVIGFWTWTALGEHFATAVYYLLPGMKLYRHISYLLLFVKILVILAAGFGMEHLHHRLTRSPTANNQGPLLPYALVILLLMGLDVGLTPYLLDEPVPSLLPDKGLTTAQHTFLLIHLALYGMAGVALTLTKRPGNHLLFILLLVGLGDVGAYRILKYQEETGFLFYQPPNPAWQKVKPSPFVSARVPQEQDGAYHLHEFMGEARLFNGVVYSEYYQLVGVDPCLPLFQYEFFQSPVYRMIKARGGHPGKHAGYLGKWLIFSDQPLLPPEDTALHASMGCLTPKLKLMGRWQTTPEDQLLDAFARLPRPDQTLLLPGKTAAYHENRLADDAGTIQIRDHAANALHLEVEVHGDEPVWLYYADAYHPAWQAMVDNRSVPVVQANVGFKAISVPPGHHQVSWQFGHDQQTWFSHLTAWIGWIAGLIALWAMAAVLIHKHRLK